MNNRLLVHRILSIFCKRCYYLSFSCCHEAVNKLKRNYVWLLKTKMISTFFFFFSELGEPGHASANSAA